jgi:hypothetical protein
MFKGIDQALIKLDKWVEKLEAETAELKKDLEENPEPLPDLLPAVAIVAGIAGAAGLIAHLTTNPVDRLTSKITTTDPLERARQENTIYETYINKMAARKKMTRTNYEQYMSTKIQLDAQTAFENAKTSNELAKIREQSESDLAKLRAEHLFEIKKIESIHEQEMLKLILDHKIDTQRKAIESRLKTKQAKLNAKIEKKKDDSDAKRGQWVKTKELKREQKDIKVDAKRQVKYTNRVHTFPLNHQLSDLRKKHSKLLDELDELTDNKTNKPSWKSKCSRLKREIKIVEGQMDDLETELRKGNNRKG